MHLCAQVVSTPKWLAKYPWNTIQNNCIFCLLWATVSNHLSLLKLETHPQIHLFGWLHFNLSPKIFLPWLVPFFLSRYLPIVSYFYTQTSYPAICKNTPLFTCNWPQLMAWKEISESNPTPTIPSEIGYSQEDGERELFPLEHHHLVIFHDEELMTYSPCFSSVGLCFWCRWGMVG